MRKEEKKGKKMREREREGEKNGFRLRRHRRKRGGEKKHTEAKATRGFDQALILYLYQRYFFYIALSLNIS